jgi:hypothetical protein
MGSCWYAKGWGEGGHKFVQVIRVQGVLGNRDVWCRLNPVSGALM